MSINLASIRELMEAGFLDAVDAANSLIGVKNAMISDPKLVAWANYTAQDFVDEFHCSQDIADTMVLLMAALKTCYQTINAQDFPPNIA